MTGPTRGLPIGQTGKFKIFLLIFASTLVVGMLLYSQRIVNQLMFREREVVDLYARSLQSLSSSATGAGDVAFTFEVIRTIDFPIVLTDTKDSAIYWKNVELDTAAILPAQRDEFFRNLIDGMDERNKPIKIAINDSLVLNHVHYGESELILLLRWLPVVEISLAGLFIFIAYIGFSYIKRSEQSNIWVGMAKETAHQLGTPLSSIMGWLERIKSSTPGSPALIDATLEMEHDIERLNKVAARFSKIGSKPDLKEEDVAEVTQSVMNYISRRIPKSGRRVDLNLVVGDGGCVARINRELFEWVIENLAKNALDALEGATGKITFSISKTGNRTIIDVTDTGKGIDPKYHKEVFRPGYSTKKRGWGLGLSLSKRIIEDYHKGRLFVKQSAPGAGTTFRIRLNK